MITIDDLKTVLTYVFGIGLSVAGWFITRLLADMKAVEKKQQDFELDVVKNYVHKNDLVSTMATLKADLKEDFAGVTKSLERIFDLLEKKQDK